MDDLSTLRDEGQAAAAPPGGAARLRLTLLGPFRAAVEGRPAGQLSPKARALLGVLALSPGGEAARVAAARMLWPGVPDANARVALRQCLRGLRETLDMAGFAGLLVERDRLTLVATGSDVADALTAAEAGAAHPALLAAADSFGRLLGDAEGLGAAFEAWRDETVAALRGRARRALAAALARARGPDARLELARALHAVDPGGESAARALMRALAARGETAAALEVYDALWRRLDETLDAEPSERTQALLERIKRGAAAPGPAGAPRGAGRPALSLRVSPAAPAAAAQGGHAAAEALLRVETLARLAAFDGVVVGLSPDRRADAELRFAFAADGADLRATLLLCRVADGAILAVARARLDGAAWQAGLDRAALRLAAGIGAALPGPLSDSAAAGAASSDWPFAPPFAAPPCTGRALALRAIEEGAPVSAAEAASAAAAAAEAVEAAPLSASARLDAGWAALLAGQGPAAAGAFLLAAELNPADAAGLREAALGLALCGDGAAARRAETLADALRPALDWRSGLTALALGEAAGRPDPAEPVLVAAWRAAALGRAGDPAAPAATAMLRDGTPPEALVARLAAALPPADPASRAALSAGLRAAFGLPP